MLTFFFYSLTFTFDTQTVPDDVISFQGQWSFQPTLLPGMDTSFHTSTNVGDRASLEFNGMFDDSLEVFGLLTFPLWRP